MRKEYLALFTFSFPYGNGESFLESEIIYLSKEYKKIFIFYSDSNTSNLREIPSNVFLTYLPLQNRSRLKRLLLSRFLILPIVIQELIFISKKLGLKLTSFKIKKLLFDLGDAYFIKDNISSFFSNKNLDLKKIVFYSYWMNNNALALALLKKEYNNVVVVSRTHRWDLYFEENYENYLSFRPFILKQLNCFSISFDGVAYIKKITKYTVELSRLGTKRLKINNLSSNPLKIIVSCSHIVPVKRVELIAKSIAKIKNHRAKWIHFGDGSLMNELLELANGLDIDFEFKGMRPNTEVLNYFQNEQIDVFINLSKSEGIPVSIMEAMSCGIPVIATDAGGTKEIVNEKNGILLNNDVTSEEVGFVITNFLSKSTEEIMEFRKNAHLTWKKKYNADINYPNFIQKISSLPPSS